MRKVNFYFAAPVRGADGNTVNLGVMEERCEWAKDAARRLEVELAKRMNLHIHIPHEWEDMYTYARLHGELSSARILERCMDEIRGSHVLLLAKDPDATGSVGMQMEHDEAKRCGLIVIPLYEHEQEQWPDVVCEMIASWLAA